MDFQGSILEWVALPFSRGSSQPRDRTHVSFMAGDSLPSEPPGELCHLVMCNSLWPPGWWPTSLLCPWGSASKNTRMGCLSFPSPIQGMVAPSKPWLWDGGNNCVFGFWLHNLTTCVTLAKILKLVGQLEFKNTCDGTSHRASAYLMPNPFLDVGQNQCKELSQDGLKGSPQDWEIHDLPLLWLNKNVCFFVIRHMKITCFLFFFFFFDTLFSLRLFAHWSHPLLVKARLLGCTAAYEKLLMSLCHRIPRSWNKTVKCLRKLPCLTAVLFINQVSVLRWGSN